MARPEQCHHGHRERRWMPRPRPFELGTKPRVAPNGYAIVPGSAFVGTWEGPGDPERPRRPRDPDLPGLHADRPEGSRWAKDADGDTTGNGASAMTSFDCEGPGEDRRGGNAARDGHSATATSSEERILRTARDNCPSGRATITAVTEGDELDWRWKQGDVEATAILHRATPRSAQPVSEDVIRELQGHEYSGTVTQWGPRGRQASYDLYYVPLPAREAGPGPGDGHTQSYDGPCMGNGVLRLESVAGDRASASASASTATATASAAA